MIARLALIFGMVAFSAVAQNNPIADRMAKFSEAYNAGDSSAVAEFYTEDGAVLPPNGAAVLGRKGIAELYRSAFGNGVKDLRYEILEVRQLGPDAVVEIGIGSIAIGGQRLRSRSMHVWRLNGEVWYLSRDMYQGTSENAFGLW